MSDAITVESQIGLPAVRNLQRRAPPAGAGDITGRVAGTAARRARFTRLPLELPLVSKRAPRCSARMANLISSTGRPASPRWFTFTPTQWVTLQSAVTLSEAATPAVTPLPVGKS